MASSHAGVYPTNRHSMDFGKFYQTSYLDMNGNIVKKSSQSSPNLQPLSRFHRPENFSYKKAPPKFGKTKKPGMLDLLKGNNPQPPARRARSTDAPKVSEQDADTEAIIKLSHYPSAQVKKDTQPAIEREDWPAPPATAIVIKNMVRTSFSKKYEDKNSDSEEEPIVDPKIQKELEEVAKIQDSAMVRCIREDVAEQIQHDKKKLLDPRSASRTPSANKEPIQPTRFTSPFNASPSRSLVERPRFISDSEASRSLKHNGTDRPAVVHGSSTSHKYRVKPGYSFGYVSKSLSTVPPGTPGAYVYDSFYNEDSEDEDFDVREMKRRMHVVDLVTRGADDEDDRDSVFESDPALNTSVANKKKKVYQRQSTMLDSVMLLSELSASQKSSDNVSSISNFDGSPFLKASLFDYRKRSESILTLWEELLFEPDEPIPYSEINLAAENRRKGLSISNLEKHLSDDEFRQHLGSTREEFYKLPEFKRNDLKRKALLF